MCLLRTRLVYAIKLGQIGKKTIIFYPLQIDNPKSIIIKNNTFIAHNAWLMGNNCSEASLVIGNNVVIGHYFHIVAYEKVEIGDHVLIADKVFISDCTHTYEDISTPIQNQPVRHLKNVSIGDGSWIGENVCIMGAKIGVHCVIGANSVVIHDIPDYCVAVGNPAKVIKYYDSLKGLWIKREI